MAFPRRDHVVDPVARVLIVLSLKFLVHATLDRLAKSFKETCAHSRHIVEPGETPELPSKLKYKMVALHTL